MIEKINKILLLILILFTPTSAHCTKFNWPELTYAIIHHPEEFDLKEIDGGTTNKNYHLKIANRDFFVRTPLSESDGLGANLATEYLILNSLANLNLSPRAYYYNEEERVMITEFINHDNTILDLDNEFDRKVLLSIVNSIHHSGVHVDHSFDLFNTIRESILYAQSLGIKLPKEFDEVIPIMLNKLEKSGVFHQHQTLCHHDIHPGNVLKKGNHYLLVDWEYGAMGDPLYDVASIASINFMNQSKMLQLLKEYNPSYTEEDWQRFTELRKLADIRWFLWCEIQIHYHPQEEIYTIWSNLYNSHFSNAK